MDINQLEAFDHVVRLGSFSKAARHLDLSQPTISIRIQGLEKEIGSGLFHRVGKRVELTEAGKGFLPYARQAIEVVANGIEKAKLMQVGKVGHVTIGTLPTFTSGVFSSVVAHLNKRFPEIHVEIHTGHNQEIIEMLYDGFIKMGLVTTPYYNTDLKRILTIKEPLMLVAHHSHPLVSACDGNCTSEEIIENADPYIIVDWSTESKHWQKSMMSPGINCIELPPSTALDFVLSTNGVALVTESMVKNVLEPDKLVTLQPADFPPLYREIALVSLDSEKSLSPVAKTVVEVFQAGATATDSPQSLDIRSKQENNCM
ncbi:LysR family transcriptional regulator [Bacillus sp. BHET2]|uniref:LysR family transcriptional regulator n=1 Tax=Bacillus sp. BHET2 TaxID=2583818 RepID=UPI0014869ED7|nr:LysR family transcriptional regulator [Bacillus sp. BHET2]